MYTVIKGFADSEDKYYPYNAGDTYPRKGFTPTEDRIAMLSKGVIKPVKEEKKDNKGLFK